MVHNRLTVDQLDYVKGSFEQCLNDELARMGNHNQELLAALIEFTVIKGCELKLHTLLSEGSIESLSDEIFTDIKVRDFILSLTDRFFLHASVFDMEDIYNNAFYQTLASILTRHNPVKSFAFMGQTKNDRYIFTPERVVDSLNPHGVQSTITILHANAWLVTLILIALYGNSIIQSFIVE